MNFLLRFTVGILTWQTTSGYGVRDYCPWETFKATCNSDEVIVMEVARYGRMKLGRCVRNDLGYVGCSTDVLDLADAECSGRRECEIKVPNANLDKLRPCLEDLKAYLEASYRCQKVVSTTAGLCRTSKFVKLKSVSGILSNLVTNQTGCGSPISPWYIEAKPGQRINITLNDFSLDHTSNGYLGDNGCIKYASLMEENPRRSKVICGGERRRHLVYTSVGNTLELRLHGLPTNHKGPFFTIEYSIFSCPNPTLSDGSTIEREGEQAVVRCAGRPDQEWRITCKNGVWHGQTGNCSGESSALGQVVIGNFTIPYGLSIAIIVVVSLFIGFVILSIGVLCLRRQQKRAQHVARENVMENDNYKQMMYTEYNKPPQESQVNERPIATKPRESNEYASIWEWPLPPPPVSEPPSYHSDRYYGTYQPRSDASEPDENDHLYQYPDAGRMNTAVTSERSPRYFELDPSQNNSFDKTGPSPVPSKPRGIHGCPTQGFSVASGSKICPDDRETRNGGRYST